MPAYKMNPNKSRREGIYEMFARNLARTRKEAGLKMYVAADLLGVSKSTWSQWESGKRFPGGIMLAAIADCLSVQPCMLLKDTDLDCCGLRRFTEREP